MKGLDAWITGANDPSAPFNETHWSETALLGPVVNVSDWITEEELDDETVSYQLAEVIQTVVDNFLVDQSQPVFSNRDRIRLVSGSAKELSNKARLLWENKSHP